MESWDDDNFEPPPLLAAAVNPNKWEGEDEEEEVKESWEDEEEEKSETPPPPPQEVKPKPKKPTLQDKIAERERRKREEVEQRVKQEEKELTPEERLRMQKESDLKLALETTFCGDDDHVNNTNAGFDGLSLPNTKEEFVEFADALSKKLTPLSKNPEYPIFTENLLRNLCATMSSFDIKRIKNTLDNLYLEKQKIEKGDKTKKNKGKGKAKLKMDDNNLSAYVNDYDDFDDFM